MFTILINVNNRFMNIYFLFYSEPSYLQFVDVGITPYTYGVNTVDRLIPNLPSNKLTELIL